MLYEKRERWNMRGKISIKYLWTSHLETAPDYYFQKINALIFAYCSSGFPPSRE